MADGLLSATTGEAGGAPGGTASPLKARWNRPHLYVNVPVCARPASDPSRTNKDRGAPCGRFYPGFKEAPQASERIFEGMASRERRGLGLTMV